MDPEQHLQILKGQRNFFEKRFEKARRVYFWKEFKVRIQEYVRDFAKEEDIEKLTPEKRKWHTYKKKGRAILADLFDLVNRIPEIAENNDKKALALFVWVRDDRGLKAIVFMTLWMFDPFDSIRNEVLEEYEELQLK